MQFIEINRPDDWHVHLRDGPALKLTVPHTAARFARAIVMPNLKPPITTTEQALAYRQRILAALPAGLDFEPLMTLYLTEQTHPDEIKRAKDSGHIYALKYYPAGATTHSEYGVSDIRRCYPVLETLAELNMLLLIHGEVVDAQVDVFDKESVFIQRVLIPLLSDFPQLKIVLEHITTKEAVDLVLATDSNLAATITPQHLLLNRNALFQGGIRPHHYCLPVLKREYHRQALLQAVSSGDPRFFLGSDSAPHARSLKETACGCAGIYSAHAGIELYAQIFEQAGILERLEGFASHYGADFYGLPRNQQRIRLKKQAWTVPEYYDFADDRLVPFQAGQSLSWQLDQA